MGVLFQWAAPNATAGAAPLAKGSPADKAPADKYAGTSPGPVISSMVRALFRLTNQCQDEDDRRAVTNCVAYTSYLGRGYLVGTDSHVLVAVSLNARQQEYIESYPDRIASSCCLEYGPGIPVVPPQIDSVRCKALMWGAPGWKVACVDGAAPSVPFWPSLVPVNAMSSDGLARCDATLAAGIDRAVDKIRQEAFHVPDIPGGCCSRMVGDPKNATTARVWSDGNILALLMPLRPEAAGNAALERVREFVATATRV